MQHASQLDSQWPALVSRVSEVIDLDASARETKALLRRREVRSAEALLRLILAYAPGGLSLRSAAAWADASGLASLSDTAVMNRIRGAASLDSPASPASLASLDNRLRRRCWRGGACASSMAASSPGRAAGARIGACTPPMSRPVAASRRSN